jgi:rhodanese-related sulfurtransferase
MGRINLPQLFGLDYGTVVLAVVIMALLMFWGAEKIESAMGGATAQKAPRWAIPAATGLLMLAALNLVIGQPDNADRWNMMEAEQTALLDAREVQISPAELLSLLHDVQIRVVMLDVREERHFNQFHIFEARRLPAGQVVEGAAELMFEPANTVFVTMGNDESLATEAWKKLKAESLPNVYILEGGVNNWIRTYGDQEFVQQSLLRNRDNDQPAYRFEAALGARHPAAEPNPEAYEIEFEPKVKLELKRAPTSGGCG